MFPISPQNLILSPYISWNLPFVVQWTNQGKGGILMYFSTTYLSPVGKLTLASDGQHLTGLWMEGQKYFGGGILEILEEKDSLPLFITVKEWLNQYFAGEKPLPSQLPLLPLGSPFRQTVWHILCEIPYGEVTTYGAIAKKAAAQMRKETMSCQAVGGAIGHNPISIIIPCHRVIGANGSLTGYAGGIATKVKLLEHEGVELSRLFIPKKGTAL